LAAISDVQIQVSYGNGDYHNILIYILTYTRQTVSDPSHVDSLVQMHPTGCYQLPDRYNIHMRNVWDWRILASQIYQESRFDTEIAS